MLNNNNNKKNGFKDFIQGNGFYLLTGVVLLAVVVTAMVIPKKGEADVAKQPEYEQDSPVASLEDISDLRVPTVEPRMDVEDEMAITEDVTDEVVDDVSDLDEDSHEHVPVIEIEDNLEEEILSETFSSTTATEEDMFHSDDDLFAWPLEGRVIYEYSDNDIGSSFINPTLDRTMRSFGLFLETKEQDKVKVAGRGEVISITQYPTAEIAKDMDFPQVGTAVIVDHGNQWKSVYGLHLGEASVEVGDIVQAGDLLGTIGRPTSDFSLTGSNLYFQLLKNDKPINPKDMLK